MPKAIAYSSKKAKGSRLEKKFAQMLRETGLDPEAQRMVGSGAWFGFETDIKTTLPFAFEMKNQETFRMWPFWEQAERARKPFRDPVLVYSANNRPMMVVMVAEDWLNLVKKAQDNDSGQK